MDLFIVRHALAEDLALDQADANRALTTDGKRTFRKVVRGLDKLDWRFDQVLTSPWTRAAQTAKLLAKISRTKPIETDLLARSPGADLIAMIATSVGRPKKPHKKKRRATAVVGHQPWLCELVGLLALGDSRHGEGLELKKGSVVWLEGNVTPRGMMIRAVLPADVLRVL